jgi:hydroxypyruvate isomerase
MAQFAANLSMLFTEFHLLDRIDSAACAGFKAVEIQFPYETSAKEIRARLDANGVIMVLHNLPAGDWAAGDRGIACNPDRASEFRDGIAMAIDYANALGVKQLNCLAGNAGKGTDELTARTTFIENVGLAGEALRKAGLHLLIEPVNSLDVPGFWLNSVPKALSILDELDSHNVKLQYDIYHAQRSGGEIATTIEQNLHRIGHIQFADNPGRHEPGTGELNFEFLFGLIDRLGYTGWIGAEYKPAGSTQAGLGWFKTYGASK